jgi:hypothetical protein
VDPAALDADAKGAFRADEHHVAVHPGVGARETAHALEDRAQLGHVQRADRGQTPGVVHRGLFRHDHSPQNRKRMGRLG